LWSGRAGKGLGRGRGGQGLGVDLARGGPRVYALAALAGTGITRVHALDCRMRVCGGEETRLERIDAGFEERGYGLWAVEIPEEAEFIGFVGLALHDFPAHFTPAVEIGWRLARDYWGRGFATEAARTAIADGFDRVGLNEIVSFTAAVNVRSAAVMQRLGMTHDPADDFDHPRLPVGHPLRRHVLYRLGRANYK
jgi:RimJ/RimL family protein N-acetyltransferase